MKKRIAIINQRYGLEVNGGSELYARQIAEHLQPYYDIDVLTSCAIDYTTWRNYYEEGEAVVNGVHVLRFLTEHCRDERVFPGLDATIHRNPHVSTDISDAWIEQLGPYCPTLVEYVKAHKEDYHLFIVVTYLYYPAVKCMSVVGDKAIFIPTAHQEPYIHFDMYKGVFCSARAFVFLTDEEKKLVQNLFEVEQCFSDVMGVGVDVPDYISEEENQRFVNQNYIIYVGRIDEGKDCPRLFQYFVEYKKRNPSNLKLILMGKEVCKIPVHKDIFSMGFVSEETKFAGIANAKLLVLPSKYESLSIAVLEAMRLKIPVLVNGICDVLKGHCVKSNAGLYYENYFEFEACLNYMLSNSCAMKAMSENASEYIDKNFSWDEIVRRFGIMIEKMTEE